jgi:hypothetical protein
MSEVLRAPSHANGDRHLPMWGGGPWQAAEAGIVGDRQDWDRSRGKSESERTGSMGLTARAASKSTVWIIGGPQRQELLVRESTIGAPNTALVDSDDGLPGGPEQQTAAVPLKGQDPPAQHHLKPQHATGHSSARNGARNSWPWRGKGMETTGAVGLGWRVFSASAKCPWPPSTLGYGVSRVGGIAIASGAEWHELSSGRTGELVCPHGEASVGGFCQAL